MKQTSLLDRLKPVVDETINSLAKTEFRIDPIGGERYSQATSIVSSAYKRHGQIIECAILERLKDCEYFTAWSEGEFRIPSVADHAIQARNSDGTEFSMELPYDGSGRKIQLDAVVFDNRIGSLKSYEIKRGNGVFDAGKKRSILKDVLATQACLKGYGMKKGFEVNHYESRVISYYGILPLSAPFSIAGEDMDDHFVFPVYDYVEEVNAYFKNQLYELLDETITRDDGYKSTDLCDRCPLHHN